MCPGRGINAEVGNGQAAALLQSGCNSRFHNATGEFIDQAENSFHSILIPSVKSFTRWMRAITVIDAQLIQIIDGMPSS